jgi:hypothetical protein
MDLLEEVSVACPYCGEPTPVQVDASVPVQELVEDCSVCCRPIELRIVVHPEGEPEVVARREDA